MARSVMPKFFSSFWIFLGGAAAVGVFLPPAAIVTFFDLTSFLGVDLGAGLGFVVATVVPEEVASWVVAFGEGLSLAFDWSRLSGFFRAVACEEPLGVGVAEVEAALVAAAEVATGFFSEGVAAVGGAPATAAAAAAAAACCFLVFMRWSIVTCLTIHKGNPFYNLRTRDESEDRSTNDRP
uniref:(northern house mosquito) hypothetical protein n=1 Tax=Culex pipiens TaxID=7175 RepID=A0A8D8FKT7_CULPI